MEEGALAHKMTRSMTPEDHETPVPEPARAAVDFIRAIIDEDLAAGKNHGRVATRFPPEPNGYLHIGHAKSICLNFGVAPSVAAPATCASTTPIRRRKTSNTSTPSRPTWSGSVSSGTRLYFASDYFEQLYHFAVELIQRDKAYVDSLTADEIRAYRGTLTEPGKDSPYRDRPIEESLDLFARMRNGEFEDGAYVCGRRSTWRRPT